MATSALFLMQIKSDLGEKSSALRADARAVSLFNETFNTMRQYDVCMSYFHEKTFIDGQPSTFDIDAIHTDGFGGRDLLIKEKDFIDDNETLQVKDISIEPRGLKVYLVMIFERLQGQGPKEVKREFAVNVKRDKDNKVYDCFDIGVNIRRTVRAKTCQGYDEVGVLDIAADGSFECRTQVMPPADPEQECIAEFDDFEPNGGFISGMNLTVNPDPDSEDEEFLSYTFDCTQKDVKPNNEDTTCPAGQVPIGFTNTGLKCKTIDSDDVTHIFVTDDSGSTTGSSSGGSTNIAPPACPEPAEASCGDNACIVETGLTLNPSTGCYTSFCNLIEPVIDCVNEWQSNGEINVPIPVPETTIEAATEPPDPAGRAYSHHLTCDCDGGLGASSKTCPEKFVGVNQTPPNECGVKCNDPNVLVAVEGEIQYRPKSIPIPNGNCEGNDNESELTCDQCPQSGGLVDCDRKHYYEITKPQGECGEACPYSTGDLTRTIQDVQQCDCDDNSITCPGNVACSPACPPGEVCVGGDCKPKTCNPECDPDETCNAGVCEPSVCTPACPDGKECSDPATNTCVDSVCSPDCPPGQYCDSNKVCQPEVCTPIDCAPPYECINGNCEITENSCTAPPCCDPECGVDEVCQSSGSGGFMGTCVGCGTPGQTCCPGDICSSGDCIGGTCTDCGDAGQVCCSPGDTCNSPLQCISGTCGDCGATGQPCCGGVGGTCTSSSDFCDNGTCNPCGAEGQGCCPGNTCGTSLECDLGSNTCKPIASGAACAACTNPDGSECIDGSCNANLCVPSSGDLCECPGYTGAECDPVCAWDGPWEDSGTCTAPSGQQGIEQSRTCVEEGTSTSCTPCEGSTTTQCIENPTTCPAIACTGVNEECIDNVCVVPDPCEGVTCNTPEEMCDAGTCVPDPSYDPCSTVTCNTPIEMCDAGTCVPDPSYDPCSTVTCNTPIEMCDSGTCVPDPSYDPCDGVTCNTPIEMCNAGSCVPDPSYDPCDGVTCSGGQTCDAGSCVCNASSCPSPKSCSGNVCEDPPAPPCGNLGQTCCNTGTPCIGNLTCNGGGGGGTCETQGGNTPDGTRCNSDSECTGLNQTCESGRCQTGTGGGGGTGTDTNGGGNGNGSCKTLEECAAGCENIGAGTCYRSGTGSGGQGCFICNHCDRSCQGTISDGGQSCNQYTGPGCPPGCVDPDSC